VYSKFGVRITVPGHGFARIVTWRPDWPTRFSVCALLLFHVAMLLIYSTKNRHPFLRDPGLRDEMFRQLGGVSQTLDCGPLIVGGMEDHVHILARQARTISVADWIKELKRVTSLWIKERDPQQSEMWDRLLDRLLTSGSFTQENSLTPCAESVLLSWALVLST
jgi:REP element-mobilizing transposase RayT